MPCCGGGGVGSLGLSLPNSHGLPARRGPGGLCGIPGDTTVQSLASATCQAGPGAGLGHLLVPCCHAVVNP